MKVIVSTSEVRQAVIEYLQRNGIFTNIDTEELTVDHVESLTDTGLNLTGEIEVEKK